MKSISVHGGHIAVVDDADYEALCRYRWRLTNSGYAMTGHSPTILMHRMVLQVPAGLVTDHINGDGLDNRRINLRVATIAENAYNSRRSSNNTCGLKGVCLHRTGRYQANIDANNTRVYIGLFTTAEEAARAYDAKARELHGAFARLNFPGPNERAA